VRRHELLERVWSDEHVSDQTLSQRVLLLRRALGDDAQRPVYVAGERGFGYRLLGPVQRLASDGSGPRAATVAADGHPYPGLLPFTEADAGHFFGREAEAHVVWERLARRPLLAVIGPSGAGKTSFVRAGVIPSRPEGWAAIACTPGSSPLRNLARALAPEVAGDSEAVSSVLVGDAEHLLDAAGRWRGAHARALVVVDQFEEIFTLAPPEERRSFVDLLGDLSAGASVNVLLVLRDDFLMRCHEHESLSPVFQDLVPLAPLTGGALHRALVEPARGEGYEFEDPDLAVEMTGSVEGERAALPLLAFAVARLWEMRDRERRRLTRAAYERIGGVAGALAQHADETLARIGPAREGVVREIFRNLVTAQGTRTACRRDEMLSALPHGGRAQVLEELVGARLLTSFEANGTAGEARPGRIEIVHESLLHAWPRLARWRAQDEEGAVLRDQLKQAAHLWEEKGRTSDLLWTGTAFREFELWRERYAGSLTEIEEDFARSMAGKARRKRRLMRAGSAAVVLLSAGVAVAIAASRHKAVVAAERAEASKLLALAQLKLQEDPTEALAYATASLDLADTKEARVMALRAVQEAPPAWEVPSDISDAKIPRFSPDGRRLAVAGHSAVVGVWDENGGPPIRLPDHETSPWGGNLAMWVPTSFSSPAWAPGTPGRCTCGRYRGARSSARSTSARRASGKSAPAACSPRRAKADPPKRSSAEGCSVPGGCPTARPRCAVASTRASSGSPRASSSPTAGHGSTRRGRRRTSSRCP
jgi:hypothetical protein